MLYIRGFLEITEPHVFLNKVFFWTINKKAFRLEGYVVCCENRNSELNLNRLLYSVMFPLRPLGSVQSY